MEKKRGAPVEWAHESVDEWLRKVAGRLRDAPLLDALDWLSFRGGSLLVDLEERPKLPSADRLEVVVAEWQKSVGRDARAARVSAEEKGHAAYWRKSIADGDTPWQRREREGRARRQRTDLRGFGGGPAVVLTHRLAPDGLLVELTTADRVAGAAAGILRRLAHLRIRWRSHLPESDSWRVDMRAELLHRLMPWVAELQDALQPDDDRSPVLRALARVHKEGPPPSFEGFNETTWAAVLLRLGQGVIGASALVALGQPAPASLAYAQRQHWLLCDAHSERAKALRGLVLQHEPARSAANQLLARMDLAEVQKQVRSELQRAGTDYGAAVQWPQHSSSNEASTARNEPVLTETVAAALAELRTRGLAREVLCVLLAWNAPPEPSLKNVASDIAKRRGREAKNVKAELSQKDNVPLLVTRGLLQHSPPGEPLVLTADGITVARMFSAAATNSPS